MPAVSGQLTRGGVGFALASSADIKGAPQVVADAAARLAIDTALRAAGMTAYQEDTGFTYRLAADLTTWNVTDTGPSSGSGIARTAVKGVVITGSAVPSGNGTFDGVAYTTGEYALLNLTSNQHLNGPYVVGAGTWTRRTTEDSAGEFLLGMTIPITSDGRIAIFATSGTITLGSTALVFELNSATAGSSVALSTATPQTLGYVGTVGTSVAAMRGDAVIPDMYRQFGDLSSVSAISLTNYPERHRFWISCVEDEFILDTTGSNIGSADGITILTTSLGGNSRLVRACVPHLRWQKRTSWYIDYTSGDDSYDGTAASHGSGLVGPLKTRGELFRRIGRAGQYLFDVAVTVTVTGSRSSTDHMGGATINLGPSGSWTESGISAEAFTISGPGRFEVLARGGVYQITPTTSVVGSAEGRSKTLLFLVDFDTSDNTVTTAWTYTLPANSSANATALIEEKTSAAAEGATIKLEDALLKNGASAAVRKGSASQENYSAKSSAYSGVTYTLGPATNDFRLTVTNPNTTAVRGTVLVALQVNPD